MSDSGLYKHIEESDLSFDPESHDGPESTYEELEELLKPLREFKEGRDQLWRVLPNGDWVRLR